MKVAAPKPRVIQRDINGAMLARLKSVAARKAKMFTPQSCL
jgi:hypothetical protein